MFPMFPMFLFPKLPCDYDLPPTLYSILESIVNFDRTDKVKIKDLAKYGRSTIFDFDYPLTPNEDKEKFECMILNKFMMRRIGYDTVTAFRIQLNVKLNEIMPRYNKLFDMLDGWELFNDGEVYTRDVNDTRNTTNQSTTSTSNNSSSSDTISNAINNSNTSISDRRFSETPENELSDVRDGKYVTNYNYDSNTDTTNTTNNTTSNGSNQSTGTNTTNGSGSDTGSLHEVTTRTPADKIRIYNEFLENRNNIYTMIFNDLESLFYGLI